MYIPLPLSFCIYIYIYTPRNLIRPLQALSFKIEARWGWAVLVLRDHAQEPWSEVIFSLSGHRHSLGCTQSTSKKTRQALLQARQWYRGQVTLVAGCFAALISITSMRHLRPVDLQLLCRGKTLAAAHQKLQKRWPSDQPRLRGRLDLTVVERCLNLAHLSVYLTSKPAVYRRDIW